ncbi:dTDP-4-dehydrorhamnose reductase [Paracoccus sp. NSM]|uniref:dTDP-4-dehydrorhamnose reductase n=1 Tax=Paracoccus sp. NSM TaxID=3457784 RepID=UPI00403633E0
MRGLLVFGRSGQVAREVARLAPDARFLGRDQADLTDPEACARAIKGAGAVLNAAAYTAVDQAETEPQTAHAVNALAPAAMARAAAAEGIPFLHLSSDYVFDGSGDHPRAEDAPTGPLGIYGASKLAGEQAVAQAGGQWAVMRTSWVFGAHGRNFVKTMLRLGAERDEVSVVDDQIGGPTPADAVAVAVLQMLARMRDDPAKGGLYHFAGDPQISWAGFAARIMAQAGLACRIRPIASADYPTPARRPLNSRLDCTAITRDFGLARPDWRDGLDRVLAELGAT